MDKMDKIVKGFIKVQEGLKEKRFYTSDEIVFVESLIDKIKEAIQKMKGRGPVQGGDGG